MNTRIARRCALALALTSTVAGTASAQTTANQSVTIAVNAINQIAFTGSPSITITTAAAGSNPTAVSDASASWAVTTNQSGAKITGSVAAALPAGVTLSVALAAPAGGSISAGSQALSTTAVDLVTGLTKLAQGGMGVTYTLSATAAAGVVASTSRVVTYTITGGT